MSIDYARAREIMVEQQVRPWDVLDPRVLTRSGRCRAKPLFRKPCVRWPTPIPRCRWPRRAHDEAGAEGRMLQSLLPQAGESVLEIGTGSGYLTACLARLSRHVVSLERHADLADAARARLELLGNDNIRVEAVDAFAWDTTRQFDVICVTAPVEAVPARFMQWLKPDGRLFAICGRSPAMEARLVRHGVNGLASRSLFETDLPYLAGAAPRPEFTL